MVRSHKQYRWAAGCLTLLCGAALASGAHAIGIDALGSDLGGSDIGPPIINPHIGDPDLTNGGRRPADMGGRSSGRSVSRPMESRRSPTGDIIVIRIQTALNGWRVFWLHR